MNPLIRFIITAALLWVLPSVAWAKDVTTVVLKSGNTRTITIDDDGTRTTETTNPQQALLSKSVLTPDGVRTHEQFNPKTGALLSRTTTQPGGRSIHVESFHANDQKHRDKRLSASAIPRRWDSTAYTFNRAGQHAAFTIRYQGVPTQSSSGYLHHEQPHRDGDRFRLHYPGGPPQARPVAH